MASPSEQKYHGWRTIGPARGRHVARLLERCRVINDVLIPRYTTEEPNGYKLNYYKAQQSAIKWALAEMDRLRAENAELRKVPVPPDDFGVVVDNESLLPEQMQLATIVVRADKWFAFQRTPSETNILGLLAASKVATEPRLSEIAARLRERVPCDFCGGEGSADIQATEPCPQCHGEKSVAATVPGCRFA